MGAARDGVDAVMKALAPAMAEAGGGRIVNVASSSGKRPSRRLDASYSVTKAAQLSLSRVFADATRPRGCWSTRSRPDRPPRRPGPVDGGLADQIAARSGSRATRCSPTTGATIPIGRMAARTNSGGDRVPLLGARLGRGGGRLVGRRRLHAVDHLNSPPLRGAPYPDGDGMTAIPYRIRRSPRARNARILVDGEGVEVVVPRALSAARRRAAAAREAPLDRAHAAADGGGPPGVPAPAARARRRGPVPWRAAGAQRARGARAHPLPRDAAGRRAEGGPRPPVAPRRPRILVPPPGTGGGGRSARRRGGPRGHPLHDALDPRPADPLGLPARQAAR